MTKQPLQKDSGQLSREILLTANDLFAQNGIEAVSMHQIAKSVGIGQGTLYRRFSNKSDLCMELMKDHFRAFAEETDRCLKEISHLPAKERLVCFFSKYIAFMDKESEYLQAIYARKCMASEEPKSELFKSPPYQYLYSTVSGLLESAKLEGKAVSADTTLTTYALIAALSPPLYIHLKHSHEYSMEQITERFRISILEPVLSGR